MKNKYYKQMVYTSKIKREVLFEGKYKGYNFYVMSMGTHPTAYIQIPSNSPLYQTHYDNINLDVHHGLTYSDTTLYGVEETGWFIGWDYAHFDDYYPYTYQPDVMDFRKMWSTEEIIEEATEAIDQIIELGDKLIEIHN